MAHRNPTFFRPGTTGVAVNPARAYGRTREGAVHHLFEGGFPYSRKLSAHTSCVNVLAFSSGGGRWLASGGDDRHVLLWDFHQTDLQAPTHALTGPRSNVFALAFSASSRYLYVGDVDALIHRYDLETAMATNAGAGQEVMRQHVDSVRGLVCHPTQDEVFMSASDDGSIVLRDCRAGNGWKRAQATMRNNAEFTSVQMHPSMEHLFVTSDAKGRVCLRDTRMAFGPLKDRSRDGVVQTYITTLSKPSVPHLCNPEVSSVAFDREGAKLAVTMLHYYPIIYALNDPEPLAICTGRNLPGGSPVPPEQRTYCNISTMKHGSFGGPALDHDEYYAAGSSDFRAYVWKIPDLSALAQQRQHLNIEQWNASSNHETVGFAASTESPRCIPVDLSTPLFRLNGHASVVNNALIHPETAHIVTAGVERHVILHSPTSSSSCAQDLAPTASTVRELPPPASDDDTRYLRALFGVRQSAREDEATAAEVDLDSETLQLFDHILRQEESIDLFATRRWDPPDEDSESDESQSES